MALKTLGVIPARMSSSRYPGKPLEEIHGMPMVGHVYLRCKMSKLLDELYVATCDQEIFDYIESIGGKAVMTKNTHERCTDRTEEALKHIEAEQHTQYDIIVMIQGDEPMVTPEMIDQAVEPMIKDESLVVVNLMAEMKTNKEHQDPNEVKVVVDQNNNAIYFSREAIPSKQKFKGEIPMLKQVCIIPFTRDFLLKYSQLKETPLEIIESVDMMRVIEHGYKVKMVPTDVVSYAVDTSEDRDQVEQAMKGDPLMAKYL